MRDSQYEALRSREALYTVCDLLRRGVAKTEEEMVVFFGFGVAFFTGFAEVVVLTLRTTVTRSRYGTHVAFVAFDSRVDGLS